MISLAVFAMAVLWGWRWLVSRRRATGVRTAARDLPRVVSDLARCVRAGATLPGAFGEVAAGLQGRLRDELEAVVGAVDRGSAFDDALVSWGRQSPVPGVGLVVGACRFGTEVGGDVARALDGAAASLLDALELDDEMRALVAQARTSAAVLVLLPLVGAAAFAAADPAVGAVLFGSTAGWVCLVLGVTLDGLAAWISARMIRAAVR